MQKEINIVSLDFNDSTKVTVNNDKKMEFEDLANHFEKGNIVIGAIVTLSREADYNKFMRRVNYLMYNNGAYYLKHDNSSMGTELYKDGFYAFRVHSYNVKEQD